MVGGSGEQQTLRLVAKYADACNLFGSVETIENKLRILRDHCKRVGRNYDEILKTKLGRIAIGKSRSEVEKVIPEIFKGVSPDRIKEMIIFGTPEDVRRQVEAFRDAGIQYLIVNCGRESDVLDPFSTEVVKQLSD